MAQFLFTAIGSYGDVHPTVGLGRALLARGHRVKLISNPYYEDLVTSSGLEFVPLGTREAYLKLSRHPDMWHPTRAMVLAMRTTSAQLRELYDLLIANYLPDETVFCAHTSDAASHVVAEKLGQPLASIVLAPAVLWSRYASPRVKGAALGKGVPRWLKQLQCWAAGQMFVSRFVGPSLKSLRAEVGLPRVKSGVLCNWLNKSELILGLFPAWFAPPQPDWPAATVLTGFPLWDSNDDDSLPDDLLEFLEAGSPPIAFCPGSANHRGHQFFEAAVEACERLGRRGILLTKYAHQLPAKLPDSVRHFGFLPMSKLLPRSAALVHHGGIGSLSQAMVAGIPHIVRPMAFDQFDNALRLRQLGVGRELSISRFSGPSAAGALAALLDSPSVAARCRQLAARCDGPTALSAACDALEQLANSRLAAGRSTVSSVPAYT